MANKDFQKRRKKTKARRLSSSETMEAVRWVRRGLWWEGFVEKCEFEFGVKKTGSNHDGDSAWGGWERYVLFH